MISDSDVYDLENYQQNVNQTAWPPAPQLSGQGRGIGRSPRGGRGRGRGRGRPGTSPVAPTAKTPPKQKDMVSW